MASATAPAARRENLLAAIRAALDQGPRLTASDMAFIASAWDISPPDALAALLADPADWGAESLVALVFTPDDAMCRHLLPTIQASAAAAEDVEWLISALTAAPPVITGRLPDGAAAFTMPIPGEGVRRFVESLRLTRRIPAALFTRLSAHLPEHRAARILNRLRMSRVPWDGDTPELLARFCERLGADDDVDALLEILVEVLETAPSPSAEAALARHKRACFRAAADADRFAESAGRHNMETLMMMGVRPPPVSADAARRRMNRIGRVSLALFGRTETIAPEAMSLAQTAIDATEAAEDPLGLAGTDTGDL